MKKGIGYLRLDKKLYSILSLPVIVIYLNIQKGYFNYLFN